MMSFNIKELIKIRKATSGSEKSIEKISTYILEFKKKVDKANRMDNVSKRKEMKRLLNEVYLERKKALKTGVSSYADPNWAAPSACETWMHCLLGGDNSEIKQAENIINELINVNRGDEKSKLKTLGLLVVFIFCPMTYYFFNWWTALIVLFIGFLIVGWRNRYD